MVDRITGNEVFDTLQPEAYNYSSLRAAVKREGFSSDEVRRAVGASIKESEES